MTSEYETIAEYETTLTPAEREAIKPIIQTMYKRIHNEMKEVFTEDVINNTRADYLNLCIRSTLTSAIRKDVYSMCRENCTAHRIER